MGFFTFNSHITIEPTKHAELRISSDSALKKKNGPTAESVEGLIKNNPISTHFPPTPKEKGAVYTILSSS